MSVATAEGRDPVLAVSGPTPGAVPARDGSWPDLTSLLAHFRLQLGILRRPEQRVVCRTHLQNPFDDGQVTVQDSEWRFAWRAPNGRERWALGCADLCPVSRLNLDVQGERLRPDAGQLASVDAWLSGLQVHCDVVAVAGFPQRDATGQLFVPLRAWLPRLWLTAGEPLAVAVVLDRRSEVEDFLGEIRRLLGGLRPAPHAAPPLLQPTEPAPSAAPVAAALERLQRPGLDKLVVAAPRLWDAPLQPQVVESRLFSQQRGAWICSFSAALLGGRPQGVLCASPELLVRTHGEHLETLALAGTLSPGEPVADHLAREHQLVVDYLDGALQDMGIEVQVGERQLRGAGPLFHLATPLSGHRPPGLDALVAALHLHPTPALLGLPRAAAVAALAELEPEPRGWYGGFAGVVSAAGDGEGEFAVLLRGAEWQNPQWRSWAGAGLVAGSTAAAEVAEIRNKHQAIGHMFGLADSP